MEIKELIKKMNVNELAPFHYFQNLKQENTTQTRIITREEYKDFHNGCCNNGNEKYNKNELGVYIIDTSVSELYKFDYNLNQYSAKKTLDTINKIFSIASDEHELIYVIFTILHEVGHWLHFKESGKTSLEYWKWDAGERIEIVKFMNEPGSIALIDYIYQKRYFQIYKNIESERIADKYAFENLEKILKIVGASTKKI